MQGGSEDRRRADRRRTLRRLAGAAIAGGVLLAAPFAKPREASSRPLFIDVSPHWTAAGRTVGPGLIGLSVEWPLLAHDLGPTGTPPPSLVEALQRLGRPPLRIGGNSQDRMWPTHAGAPIGATWAPTPRFWTGLAALERQAGGGVLVGLDLAHGVPMAARAIAADARRALGTKGVTYSLGNEPDRYGIQSWARVHGRRVTARPRSWSFAAYLRQYADMRHRARLGTLVGPDVSSGSWRTHVASFVTAQRPSAVTVHAYPLDVCGKSRHSDSWPTSSQLLGHGGWSGAVKHDVTWAAAAAARAHRPLLVSEANSVACRGARGLSDGPPAALWAPAFILSAAEAGASQVDLHASDSPYDPFHVARTRGGGLQAQPRALYDGMLLTNQLVGAGGQLVSVGTRPSQRPAWAVRGAGGEGRVLVENVEAKRSLVARIALPPGTGSAQVVLMRRAGRDATGRARMTIGGRMVVAAHGHLTDVGRPAHRCVRVVHGHVRVSLPAWSAALVSGAAPGCPPV